ncbi:MAG: helix-turn-helix transcriptional regulator [Candidatus Micrarchaeia archaeon]
MNNSIFLKEKQARILSALKNKKQEMSISALAKASDATYVHVSSMLSKCERLGLITAEKHGRVKIVRLTEKGNVVAEMLEKISDITSGTEI